MWKNRKPRQVVCEICGDTFETRSPNGKYCPDICRAVATKRAAKKLYFRKTGRVSRVGDLDACKHCGKQFLVKHNAQVHCRECAALGDKRGNKGVVGSVIKCLVCGEDMIKRGANSLMHQRKCAPKPDFKRRCSVCGEVKCYEEFYDNRNDLLTGKLESACKYCLRERTRARAARIRKENGAKPRNIWSQSEISVACMDIPIETIALKVGRSEASVRTKRTQLRMAGVPIKSRKTGPLRRKK